MAPHRRVDRGSLSRGRRALTREPVSGFEGVRGCDDALDTHLSSDACALPRDVINPGAADDLPREVEHALASLSEFGVIDVQ